jgi:peptide/nickel transport system substrate-binding protein
VTPEFFHGDQNALKKAVQDAEADIAYRGLTAEAINDIERAEDGTGGTEVVEGSSAEVQHLVFTRDDPVVGRRGVRRAIAHPIDRDALVRDVHQGTAGPLCSIVPAGIAGHHTAFFDTCGARPSKAEAAAALEEGITGKAELTLWSTPSRYGPATDQELKAIAGRLDAGGLFDADVESVPFAQYEKDIAVLSRRLDRVPVLGAERGLTPYRYGEGALPVKEGALAVSRLSRYCAPGRTSPLS